jgi:hypothetical protein
VLHRLSGLTTREVFAYASTGVDCSVDAAVARPALKSSAVYLPSWLCRRRVDVPFGTTALVVVARTRSRPSHGHDCGGLLHGRYYICSPAMSMPSWRDRHSACFNNYKKKKCHNYYICSPAMSMPSWRDRHSACFNDYS